MAKPTYAGIYINLRKLKKKHRERAYLHNDKRIVRVLHTEKGKDTHTHTGIDDPINHQQQQQQTARAANRMTYSSFASTQSTPHA